MRFEDQAPSGDRPGSDAPPPPPPPPAPEPGARPRRRTRSWSTPPAPPSAATTPRRDVPISDEDWSLRGRRPLADTGAPPAPPAPPIAAPPPAADDLGPVTALLGQLRAEVGQVRTALAAGAADRDTSLVTGAELAATIEALGTTLGNGMATLLTEHRNLLARDLDAAAERILEELGQRLRTSTTQTVDAVEERLRQVTSKALGDLSEQLDLRLDQLQTDVAGLRAVMLEIPDQTAVTERLDQIVDAVGSARNRDTNRITPAMTAALERSVASALEPLESLTEEMQALRRRITLRTGTKAGAVDLSDAQLEALADRMAARLAGTAVPSATASARARAVPVDDEDDEGFPLDLALQEEPEVEEAPARRRPGKVAAKRAPKRR